MVQALIIAQNQVNLATLASFSSEVLKDQFTAAQMLQKLLLHRQALAWHDGQTIADFRNPLKRK
jgi:hypothetical protein